MKPSLIITGYRPGCAGEELLDWANVLRGTLLSWSDVELDSIRVVSNLGMSRILPCASREGQQLVEMQNSPQGALATAVFGASSLQAEAPLIVAAGDTSISNEVMASINTFLTSGFDAGLLVFRSDEGIGNWSYVHVDPDTGDLLQVTEGSDPTEVRTVGIFLFRTASIFLDAAKWCFLNHVSKGNLYFTSSTINYLLTEGKQVFISVVPRESFDKAGR